jgi:hypothetical protein
MITLGKKKFEPTKMQIGVQSVAKAVSVILMVLGVIYCEVMYISVSEHAFPNGFLRIFAITGAMVSGISVLLLLLSKSYWFTEGVQLIFAYVFTGVEIIVIVLNVLVAFAINGGGQMDGWLQLWNTWGSPATPVFAIVGWMIIWQLDQGAKRRHRMTELEDSKIEAEADYQEEVASQKNNLRADFLSAVTEHLQAEMRSEYVKQQARIVAIEMAAEALTMVAGRRVAPRVVTEESSSLLPGPSQSALPEPASDKKTEELQPVSMAQTADAAPAPVPAKKKRGRPAKQAESTPIK